MNNNKTTRTERIKNNNINSLDNFINGAKIANNKTKTTFFYTFFSFRSSPNKCQPILFNILKGLQYKCLTSQGAMAGVVSRSLYYFFMRKFQLIFNCFVKKWFYWYFAGVFLLFFHFVVGWHFWKFWQQLWGEKYLES